MGIEDYPRIRGLGVRGFVCPEVRVVINPIQSIEGRAVLVCAVKGDPAAIATAVMFRSRIAHFAAALTGVAGNIH